jgi:photosystem II stability/assembly factor-like uncharacterized protein
MKKQLLLLNCLIFLVIGCSNPKLENTVEKNTTTVESQEKSNEASSDIQEISAISSTNNITKNNISYISKKSSDCEELSETEVLRKKHQQFLANSPFKNSLNLTKSERKALGIPPKKYYELEWELTMNPETGRPNPENLHRLRNKLLEERQQAIAAGRTPGDASDNNWVERGPNNVGGRVRAVMFDPNDATYRTVFAGGVSGGLWKNTDITANTAWTRVNIPDNLAVSAITYDPNNTNVFYLGTGESYVGGDVNGDGVWKSVDGGNTWTKIFGGISGATTFESAAAVRVNSPVSIANDYACYPTTAFGLPLDSNITSDIVLVNDGSGATSTLGCNGLTNAAQVNGKIALIRRGSCTFVQKVKNAQNAGAIAVIMMNNIDGTPVPMGGTDETITIPSVMISKADGDILQAALGSGNVNVTLIAPEPGQFTGNLVPGIQYVNDIKIRNNGGVSEIYLAAGDSFYSAANAVTYMSGPDYGLYKSVDGGANWQKLNLPLTGNGNTLCPNDIEVGADNTIWLSTIKSTLFNDGGGKVLSSTDGVNFFERFQVPDGDRTQIAVSSSASGKVYVLAEISTGVAMYTTSNSFASSGPMALPSDADTGIPANDFCRGQAFFDLMLEVDPDNDNILYAGGIDLFRSTNGGGTWTQISKWSNNNNLSGLTCSLVHADQHGMAFRPGNSNQAIFGNDGGVFYTGSLSTAATNNVILARNNNLNITQFYSLGVAPTSAVSGLTGNNYFAAGSQDNGTQYFGNVAEGINSSVQSQGGDGAYTMFDQGADRYYISNYVYNQQIIYRPIGGGTNRTINSEGTANGAFIAPMGLDSSLDILYADYSLGTATPPNRIRRYTNLKSGTVGRTLLTNDLLTSPPTAFTVSPYTTGSTTLLVGTRLGRLLRLTNANTTPVWADISGPSFVGSISDVEYGRNNNEIFVTFHNYNVVSIWYTNDGGLTWQNKEGNFPDIPVKAILQNPLNTEEVIIGTELGVWFTNNFSSPTPTWNQSYNGMSNVKVTDLDLRNDNTVFAATYGRGIFSGVFTSTTLSNNDNEFAKATKMYPNPSNGIVNLSIPNYAGNIKIEFYDINGKVVYSDSFDYLFEKTIDLNRLQSGIYIARIEGDGFNYSEKIIKK